MTKRNTADTERPFKRVNSKEELVGEDAILHPQRFRPSLRELSSRRRIFSSALIKDITSALTNSDKREKALKATESAHCSESLKCLIAILDWEQLADDPTKEQLARGLVQNFVSDESEAVCLPGTLQHKMRRDPLPTEELYDGILEIKKIVLNDLRFNSILLNALNSKE